MHSSKLRLCGLRNSTGHETARNPRDIRSHEAQRPRLQGSQVHARRRGRNPNVELHTVLQRSFLQLPAKQMQRGVREAHDIRQRGINSDRWILNIGVALLGGPLSGLDSGGQFFSEFVVVLLFVFISEMQPLIPLIWANIRSNSQNVVAARVRKLDRLGFKGSLKCTCCVSVSYFWDKRLQQCTTHPGKCHGLHFSHRPLDYSPDNIHIPLHL